MGQQGVDYSISFEVEMVIMLKKLGVVEEAGTVIKYVM